MCDRYLNSAASPDFVIIFALPHSEARVAHAHAATKTPGGSRGDGGIERLRTAGSWHPRFCALLLRPRRSRSRRHDPHLSPVGVVGVSRDTRATSPDALLPFVEMPDDSPDAPRPNSSHDANARRHRQLMNSRTAALALSTTPDSGTALDVVPFEFLEPDRFELIPTHRQGGPTGSQTA